MATPKKSKKKWNTMAYYKSHPEAYKKKKEYEMKRSKLKKVRDKFNERRREKRRRGLEGKMDSRDMSHTKNGKLVLEHRSKNRSKNGENGKSVLKQFIHTISQYAISNRGG